jgi:hypothetical protein
MSLIIFYSFAMPWGCVWWHKTYCQKPWWDKWWNIDGIVIEQWCLWFGLFNSNFKVLRCHWSYFIFLQCLGSVFGDTRPFDQNNDQTVMRQWWNSDATVMQLWCLWFGLFYVIFKIWRCHWSYSVLLQFLGSVIMHLLTKTVMRQWWDSDGTVMEQWCLWFKLFYVISKLLRCHWSYFIIL